MSKQEPVWWLGASRRPDMPIERLKAKAGYGGAKLEIHVRRGEPKKGQPLRGEVHLVGGKAGQRVRCLLLRLIREWSTESYGMDMEIGVGPGHVGPYTTGGWVQAQYELDGEKGKEELIHIVLGKDINIHAGERRFFPFEIELTKKIGEKGVREVWKLKAQADIPLARDAFAERRIQLK